MTPSNPALYVLAGPNGAGKTTFARKFLTRFVECGQFVNADLIAAGLSPFDPESVSIQAGRLMLEQIRRRVDERRDFAFETTLSGKSYLPMLAEFQKTGYLVHLSYLWLDSADLAIGRVADRVRQGGHHIPEEVIRRRFQRGLYHFVHDYGPLVDSWIVFDNTHGRANMIAFTRMKDLTILDEALYRRIIENARR